MTQLKLEDTMTDAVMKMAEGIPGAITVCAGLVRESGDIDPDSALGGFGNILSLDQLGIYESRIWMLYKNVCGEDIVTMVGVLRAHQLGFLSTATLSHAVDNRGEGIDCAALLQQVRDELPNFRKASEPVDQEAKEER